MDAFKKYLSKSKINEAPSDLNRPEDVRRVIEKVEVIDSVDVDAIHSQLTEIAKEKAAARQLQDNTELQSSSEKKVDKPKSTLLGFEDFPKLSDKSISEPKNEQNQGANVSMPNKTSVKNIKGIETEESNPYIDTDNFTAFID